MTHGAHNTAPLRVIPPLPEREGLRYVRLWEIPPSMQEGRSTGSPEDLEVSRYFILGHFAAITLRGGSG